MKNKLTIFIFTLFLMLSFGIVEQVFACSCYPSMPCRDYQEADISFFGKVIEKSEVEDDIYKTTFQVYENYKNAKTKKEIDIYSRGDGGICGYNFEIGLEYIVFARKSSKPKGFWTGSCYGNVRTSYNDSSLFSYLREVSNNGTSSMISGSIWEWTHKFAKTVKLNDIEIKAQNIGSNNIYIAKPNEDGIFNLNVPEGNYLLKPKLPKSYIFGERRKANDEILTVENQKCSAKFLLFWNDSELKGKLVNVEGIPIKNTEVELISVNYTKDKPNDNYDYVKTNENGEFVYKYIPVGDYVLGLNYTGYQNPRKPFPKTFYAQTDSFNKAQIIKVGLGEKIDNIIFQLPFQIRSLKMKGIVYGLNDKPVKGADIFLRDAELNNWVDSVGTKTNENGEFTLEGFEGRKYKIYVTATIETIDSQSGYKNAKQFTQIFRLDDNTEEFKIVLPLKLEDKKK